MEDFDNAVIGVQTGSVYEDYAKELFPNAELQYYELMPDMILALSQGKIDVYISETSFVVSAQWEGSAIEALPEVIDQTDAGFIFSKNRQNAAVYEQLNTFIREGKENGFFDDLKAKWFSDTEPTDFFDPSSLTGENGTLRVELHRNISL